MQPLHRDPLVRSVEWRDLLELSNWQRAREFVLPIAWMIAAIAAFECRCIPVTAVASFFFFLTALRLAHGARHYSLGVSERRQDFAMLALGVPMLASLHALQANASNGDGSLREGLSWDTRYSEVG